MKTRDDKDFVDRVEESQELSESSFNDRSASANQTFPSGMAGVANAAASAISSVVSAAFSAVTFAFSKKRGRSEEHLEGAASVPTEPNPHNYPAEDKTSEICNQGKRSRLDTTGRDKKNNAGSTTAEIFEKSNEEDGDQPAVANFSESTKEAVHPNQSENSENSNESENFVNPVTNVKSESEHGSNIENINSIPSASIVETVLLSLPERSSNSNSNSETSYSTNSGGDGEEDDNDDDGVNGQRGSNAGESIDWDRFIERFQMLHLYDRHTPVSSPPFANPASTSAGLFFKIETETDLKNEFTGLSFNPPQESEGIRNLASNFGQLSTASPPLDVANENPNPNPNSNQNQSNVAIDAETDVSPIPTNASSPVSPSTTNESPNLSSEIDARPSPLDIANDLGTNKNQSNVAIDSESDESSISTIASTPVSPTANEIPNLSSSSDKKPSNEVIQTPEPPNTLASEHPGADSPSLTADSSPIDTSSINSVTEKNPIDSKTLEASNHHGATLSENTSYSSEIECDLLRSKGNEFFKSGNYEDAMQCYNEAVSFIKIKMNIENQDASCFYKSASLCYCNRAAVKINLQMYGSALADCHNALTLNPEYTKAKCRAAKCLLMFGLAEKSIALVNESVNELSKKDDEQLAHEIIREAKDAMSAISGKDQTYTEALESMERFLGTYPLSVQAAGMKARLLLKLGKFEDAKNFWQDTRTVIVDALLPFNETEKLSLPSSSAPSLPSTFLFSSSFLSRLPCLLQVWQRVIHGRVLFGEGDLERALRVLKEADKEFVTLQENGVIDSVFIEKPFDLQSYISDLEKLKGFKMEGNKAFHARKMENAIRSYDSALAMPVIGESRSFCAVIFCNRAAARMSMECYANAMDDCSCAIALQPSYEKALSRRIEVSRKVRDFDRAISDLQTLIRIGEEKERRRTTPYSNPAHEADLNRKRQLLASLMESDREGIPPQHYLILGLDSKESSSRCKTLYLKLAIKHHPDKAYNFLSDYDRNTLGDVVVRLRKAKEHFFKLIQNASSILSDPQTRQNFDAEENARNEKKRGFESTNSRNDFGYQHQHQNQNQNQNQNQQHNFNNNNNNYNQYSSNFGFGFGSGSGSNGVPPNEPPHQPPPAQRRRQSNFNDYNNNPNYNQYSQNNQYNNYNTYNTYNNQNFNGYYYAGSNAQGHGKSHNFNAQ